MPSSCSRRWGSRRLLAVLVAALAPLVGSLGPGAAVEPATKTVLVEAMAFQPAVLTVKAGDAVVWVNKDPFPHTATAGAFDSKSIAAGGAWTYRTTVRGEFAYVCTLHPAMKAVLRVQ